MTIEERYQEAIERGYHYNPETGDVYRNINKPIRKRDKDGYIVFNITINGKKKYLKAHRFAWFYMFNYFPLLIDHIDREPYNNKLENLREANSSINQMNKFAKGYTFIAYRNQYRVQICVDGIYYYLGYYDTEEEANQVYLEAKKTYHKIANPT